MQPPPLSPLNMPYARLMAKNGGGEGGGGVVISPWPLTFLMIVFGRAGSFGSSVILSQMQSRRRGRAKRPQSSLWSLGAGLGLSSDWQPFPRSR